MEKQRGAVLLILLFLVILLGWWSVSTNNLSSGGSAQGTLSALASVSIDTAYAVPTSLDIHHTSDPSGEQGYTGELSIPQCDTFSTQMATTNTTPEGLTISFIVSPYEQQSCSETTLVNSPFSLATMQIGSTSPVIENLTINNKTVKVRVIED